MKKIFIVFIIFGLFSFNTKAISNKESNKAIEKFKRKKKVNSPKEKYPIKAGTILVTTDAFKKVLPIGHSAVVVNKDYVYEATSKGVVRGKNNWLQTKKKMYAIRVNKLNDKQHKKIVDYSKKQLNKKYNYNFFNTKTRKKFYCSHLAWSAIYDTFNINTDTYLFNKAGTKNAAIHPIELVMSKNTKTVFYYANK